MNKTLSKYIVISLDEFGNELWRQDQTFKLKLKNGELRTIGHCKMQNGRLWYKKVGSHYHVNGSGYSVAEMLLKELIEWDSYARVLIRAVTGDFVVEAKKFLSEGKRRKEENLEVQFSLEVSDFDFTPLPRKVNHLMDEIL